MRGPRERRWRLQGRRNAGSPLPMRGCQPFGPTASSARRRLCWSPPASRSSTVSLEVRRSNSGRLDCEAGLLEAPKEPLPLLFRPGRILLDEHEVGAGGKRFGEPHARPDTCLLGLVRTAAEEGPLPGAGAECDALPVKRRPGEERGPKLEGREGEAGDHGNICSTRTHVPLSTNSQEICALSDVESAYAG